MNMRWSLKELYQDFESDKFQNDLVLLEEIIRKINEWKEDNLDDKNNAASKIKTFLNYLIEYYNNISLLNAYAGLRLSVNTKDNEALKYLEQLEKKRTRITGALTKFQKWLGTISKLQSVISSSNFLREHTFVLNELADNSVYLLEEEEEIIVSEMKNTGSRAWSKLQQLLTSTLMVDIEIEGKQKKLPLSVVRNMAYDKDQNIRKKAYTAELEAYNKIEDSVAASLNAIKGEVNNLVEKRGYKSSLEKTLRDSRMDEKTLEAMINAIKNYLPEFHKYFRKKAEILGHEKGLPFYDLFAPVNDAVMEFTYEEASDFIINNFNSYSDKMGGFARKAFTNNWIDAEPREGKTGGAFCYNIHALGESRILANFTGSFNDMSTLAHELGHGYHGDCLLEESILNSNYPMPLAETASIFCQTIINNAALRKANSEQAINILENSLSDAGQVIVDIYSRYLFESKVFDRRGNASLSVEELKQIMLESQKEAYGDGLDHEYLHPYMWVCKSHYYSGSLSFYNFPYAFGLLFGLGLYAEYLKRGEEFIKQYDELLATTGKQNIAAVASAIDIEIKSSDFWESSLNLIKKDIKKFIELS